MAVLQQDRTQIEPAAYRQGLLAGLICIFLFTATARGQEPAAVESLFVTVGNPITGEVMSHVKKVTEDARRRYREAVAKGADDKRRLKIVYDFNPDNQPSASALFGPCLDLAAYLRAVNDVDTIAFVHKEVARHTVLPVLACKEMVMASGDDVRVGNVYPEGTDQPPRNVDLFYKDYQVSYYKDLAEQRGRSPAIVLKMLDRGMEVLQGTRADGSKCFVDRRRWKEEGAVSTLPEPVLAAGSAGFYNARQATRFDLCKRTLETRQEVAEALEMPLSGLREDPLQGRTPKAWRVVVDGTFTRPMEEKVRRRLSRAVGQGANFIILQLECGGGDPIVARDLADFIRDLKDNAGHHPVMTVAYVTEQARTYALFLALGCNDIVMDPKAKLGDFDRLVGGGAKGPAQEAPANLELVGKSLAALAGQRDYSPLLVRGMVEPDLAIYEARAKKNPTERRFLTEEELRDDQKGEGRWNQIGDGPIKAKGQLLSLEAAKAQDVGLSRYTVDNLKQVYTHYGMEEGNVRLAAPDWFEEFAAFLRNKAVAVILVMIGITCLILELKMPGVGLPGIISALCFILFFWAHAQLAFTWLAVLLFLMGLVLIALEIFVMPGVAILGGSGIVLILASLGLATLERWPQTEGEWVTTATSTGRFGLAFVGAVLAAIVAARYLPSIPYANRLVLVPPAERAEALAAEATAAPGVYAGLLGAIGVAATTLRPSGMVRFGDEFIDVVAEGSFVAAGTRVQVIEIEGNHIVVKEV